MFGFKVVMAGMSLLFSLSSYSFMYRGSTLPSLHGCRKIFLGKFTKHHLVGYT